MFKTLSRRRALMAVCLSILPALAHAAPKPGIAVTNGWVRAAPVGASAGAAYLTLANTGPAPDRLVGGSSSVAARVEVHEMSMDGGVMRMRPVTGGLSIPAGGSVALKPGGYHIMLIGLRKPLTAGTTIPLTLSFERAGGVRVQLPVRTAQP